MDADWRSGGIVLSIILILILFLIFILAYFLITSQIRNYVLSKHDEVWEVEYIYTPQPMKFLNDLVNVWWYGRILQMKLVSDMRFYLATPDISKPNLKPVKSLERKEKWTTRKTTEICQMGYLPANRLHDSIPWLAIPVYIRFDNPQRFIVPDTKDEKGHFLYPQDTPSTLYDKWHSNATKEFIKNMSKLGVRQVDTQTMIMMGIIGVGAIVGLWMMGFF